jgi:hypothetical protein
MSATAIVESVWSNAQNLAAQYQSTATSNLNAAIGAAGGVAPSVGSVSFGGAFNVVEPPVNIPMNAQAAGFEQFRETWTETINDLTTRFRDFIVEYMPNETPYIDAAQQWLNSAITNGETGLIRTVEDQIWQRQRDRITKDSARAESEIIDSWASRGFAMPPGAAIHAVGLAKQQSRDLIAEAASKVAIAQAELEQKNMQFAVENSIKLWTGAMGAAGEYIKAIATGPQAAGQIIPSITDSQAKLISAASSYYNARISVQELALKASLPSSQWAHESAIKDADIRMQFIAEKVKAAIGAAQIAGTIASSALNALHASASASDSSSLNHNWSGELN